MTFLKTIGLVMLAVFLGTCWQWTIALKEKEWITPDQRLYAAGGLTLGFIIYQICLIWPTPTPRGVVEARKQVIEHYLQDFLDTYLELVAQFVGQPQNDLCVRANIMLPTSRWKGIGGTYLKIYYVSCPPRITYSNEERSLKWKKKVGSCGWAWKTKDPCPFDSEDKTLSLPAESLKPIQHRAVLHLKSVLSIPILDKETSKVVGILNLDSVENVEKTHFNDGAVHRLALGMRDTLVAHCFPNGVAP